MIKTQMIKIETKSATTIINNHTNTMLVDNITTTSTHSERVSGQNHVDRMHCVSATQ